MDQIGPYLHSIEVSLLSKCSSEIAKDPLNLGISCTKHLLNFQEIVVEYPTDIHRLKKEASALHQLADDETRANADLLVIANATLLTMESGNLHNDVLRDAIIVTRAGEIEAIVGANEAVIPYGATILDAAGGKEISIYAGLCADNDCRIYCARFH